MKQSALLQCADGLGTRPHLLARLRGLLPVAGGMEPYFTSLTCAPCPHRERREPHGQDQQVL